MVMIAPIASRLSFSPDGLLLVAPTGLHRPPQPKKNVSTSSGTAAKSAAAAADSSRSFCTHIFSRFSLTSPCLSLVGLEDPSVAVRFCPLLFKPLLSDQKQMMIDGDYRSRWNSLLSCLL